MSTAQPSDARDETKPPDDDDAAAARAARPTVDDMGMWSFPASDPPATWNWEPRAGGHADITASR